MLRPAFPLIVLALMLPATLPGAMGAAHFAKWTSDGIAVDADGAVYNIEIVWHGSCYTLITVTLSDATGAAVEQRTFRAFEALTDTPQYLSGIENLQVLLSSGDATVLFDGSGYQRWNTDGSAMWQVLTGHYQGLTYVAASPGNPWTFC
ncbi:MAG TPA: hypothetical protein VGR28_15175 [Candidatus Thermoplasmatota archaeon]|jgi:hypothetical protein|nr:hypothetical protein [Candidatus Thermoplasmatota archaeon]